MRHLFLVALAGAMTVAGCASRDDVYRTGHLPPEGTYAWCAPPCFYPRDFAYPYDFADTRFFYPATPYYYGPFDPIWSYPWIVQYQPPPQPVTRPRVQPPPKPPTRQQVPRARTPRTQ